MTAEDIQQALRAYFDQSQTGRYHVNNVYFFNHYWGESDFLTFSKAGLVHEIEIKISLADFKADFAKPKHRYMATPNGWVIVRGHEFRPGWEDNWGAQTGIQALPLHDVAPNRFSFAVPQSIVEKVIDRVPAYAGLYAIHTSTARQIRKAPILHDTHHNFTSQLLDKYWWNRRKVQWDLDVARSDNRKLQNEIDHLREFLQKKNLLSEYDAQW